MPNTPAPPISIAINHTPGKGGGYVEVPRWWIDNYFCFVRSYTVTGKHADRLPGSFWKYTLYLWRWLSVPRAADNKYHTYIPMDQFPVRADAAVQWTWAYHHSGVVQVELGRFTKKHDRPTQYFYEPTTSVLAWQCFFGGLQSALAYYTAMLSEHRHKHDRTPGSNTYAWRILVAREIDAERGAHGLPAFTSKEWYAQAVTDKAASYDKDGLLVPVIHSRATAQRKNETDTEYDFRLAANFNNDGGVY